MMSLEDSTEDIEWCMLKGLKAQAGDRSFTFKAVSEYLKIVIPFAEPRSTPSSHQLFFLLAFSSPCPFIIFSSLFFASSHSCATLS